METEVEFSVYVLIRLSLQKLHVGSGITCDLYGI